MAKSLFDHIKAVTKFQDPNYWDKLEDGEENLEQLYGSSFSFYESLLD